MPFDVGDSVVIKGLVSRTDLNGQHARIFGAPAGSDGRVAVMIKRGGPIHFETIRVKVCNLQANTKAREGKVPKPRYMAPDLTGAPRTMSREACLHFNRGVKCSARGDAHGSRQEWERALALCNDEQSAAPVLLNLAQVHGRLGNVALCCEYSRRCIAVDPCCALAHSNLGSVLSNSGAYAEALPSFERCLELHPDRALKKMVLANQGFTLRLVGGREEEALASLRRYVELTPASCPEYMTKQVRMTINEIESQVRDRAAGLQPDKWSCPKQNPRGEEVDVTGVATSWYAYSDLCGACGAPATGRGRTHALCTGCHLIGYCSTECQRLAWKRGHKRTCATQGDMPTPAALLSASPATVLSMLTEHQAGHASFALRGLMRILHHVEETDGDVDDAATMEVVKAVMATHCKHARIHQLCILLGSGITRDMFRNRSVNLKETIAAQETAAMTLEFDKLSVVQLKHLVTSRGVSYVDCLERVDLETRALEACQPTAE